MHSVSQLKVLTSATPGLLPRSQVFPLYSLIKRGFSTSSPKASLSTLTAVHSSENGLNVSRNTSSSVTKSASKLNFNDGKEAYKSKSTLSLLHSILVFKMCSIKPLVDHSETLVSLGRKILGDKLMVAILKPTLYDYFCAGETTETIKPTLDHLRKYGVGAILDYAAESDIVEAAASPVSSSRYEVSKDHELDANVTTFVSCINTTAAITRDGFAAIKYTALADTLLLERATHTLNTLRYLFINMVIDANNARAISTSTSAAAPQELDSTATLTFTEFTAAMSKYFSRLSAEDVKALWCTLTKRSARASIVEFLESGKVGFGSSAGFSESGVVSFDDWYHGLSLPQMCLLSTYTSPEYTFTAAPMKPYVYTHTYVTFTTGKTVKHTVDSAGAAAVAVGSTTATTAGPMHTRASADMDVSNAVHASDATLPVGVFALDADDIASLHRVYTRSRQIMQLAREKKVRTLVDAEHCYFQPAIDGVTVDMQRVYNALPAAVATAAGYTVNKGSASASLSPSAELGTGSAAGNGVSVADVDGVLPLVSHPVVWNTYQNYLTDCTHRLHRDLDTAQKEGFYWGAKLVRGAYMILERKLAVEGGFLSPIEADISATHTNYNDNICDVIARGWSNRLALPADAVDAHVDAGAADSVVPVRLVEVMAASHNQTTMEIVTDKIIDLIQGGRAPVSGYTTDGNESDQGSASDAENTAAALPDAAMLRTCGVYFGQLLGMADHLTFTLGQNNFSPYKYVPYGKVMEVLPYLIRRAQENSNMLGGVGHERRMLWREFARRVKVRAGLGQ